MKKIILVEDHPPTESADLLPFVLSLAIVLLAGITIGVVFW